MDCILYLRFESGVWILTDNEECPSFEKTFDAMESAMIWAGQKSFAVFYFK